MNNFIFEKQYIYLLTFLLKISGKNHNKKNRKLFNTETFNH